MKTNHQRGDQDTYNWRDGHSLREYKREYNRKLRARERTWLFNQDWEAELNPYVQTEVPGLDIKQALKSFDSWYLYLMW